MDILTKGIYLDFRSKYAELIAPLEADREAELRVDIKRWIDDNFYVKDGFVYFLTTQDNVYKVEYKTLFEQRYNLLKQPEGVTYKWLSND